MFFRRPLAGPCFECSVDRVVSRVPDPVRCAVGPPVGPDACRAGICRCATRPVASVISPARALRQVASTVRPGFEGVPGGLVFRLPYACALAGSVWSVVMLIRDHGRATRHSVSELVSVNIARRIIYFTARNNEHKNRVSLWTPAAPPITLPWLTRFVRRHVADDATRDREPRRQSGLTERRKRPSAPLRLPTLIHGSRLT